MSGTMEAAIILGVLALCGVIYSWLALTHQRDAAERRAMRKAAKEASDE